MIKKDRDICRIWDGVNEDHPDKSDEWRFQMTCDFYAIEFNDSIDVYDILSALEERENSNG